MKILLSGATGAVGSELGVELVRQGHSLNVLTRNPRKSKGVLPYPAQIFEWDALKGPPPAAAFDGVEAVIHLAGESIASGRWNDSRKKAIFDSRVIGTRNLVEGILQATTRGQKIRAFLSASAIGIYGDRGDEALTEAAVVNAGESGAVGFLSHVCKEWEKAATTGLPASVRTAQLRIGLVLGHEGGTMAELLPLFRKGLGGRLGSGSQWMSWIHVHDLARLFEFVLTHESISGPVNATAPEPVINREFTRELAASVGRPAVVPAPGAAIRVAVGAFAQAVLSSQKVIPAKAQAAGFEFKYRTLASALADLVPHPQEGRLLVRQWIASSIDEVFGFFSDARNLERITPAFLNFKIIGMSTPEVGRGTLIDYRLKVHGLPVKWRTLIESWQPKSQFVDTQLKGPYKKWHHTHRFEPMAGGVLIEDEVHYRLPMGWLGEAVAGGLVTRDVQSIFQYRREVIAGMFAHQGDQA